MVWEVFVEECLGHLAPRSYWPRSQRVQPTIGFILKGQGGKLKSDCVSGSKPVMESRYYLFKFSTVHRVVLVLQTMEGWEILYHPRFKIYGWCIWRKHDTRRCSSASRVELLFKSPPRWSLVITHCVCTRCGWCEWWIVKQTLWIRILFFGSNEPTKSIPTSRHAIKVQLLLGNKNE